MRNLRYFAALLALLVLLTSHAARAQTPEELPPPAAPARALPDSARRVNQLPPTAANKKQQAAADSIRLTERLFGLRFTRPGKAALLATVAPGAGQLYNRRYWKLPLVYALLGGTLYGEIHYQSLFREYVTAYDLVASTKEPIGSAALGSSASRQLTLAGIQNGIVFYRGQRDIFFLYIGLSYTLQIVDALVDANLRDFDVSDDLSLHWEPTLLAVPGRGALPTAPGLAFALRVK